MFQFLHRRTLQDIIGKILYRMSQIHLAPKPYSSSGYAGETTCGYGKLYRCGNWQYPVDWVAREFDKKYEEEYGSYYK